MKETQNTFSNASLPTVYQPTSNNNLSNLYCLLVPNRMINSWPHENNAPSNDDILEALIPGSATFEMEVSELTSKYH